MPGLSHILVFGFLSPRLLDFLYNVFRFQVKMGKKKLKINKLKTYSKRNWKSVPILFHFSPFFCQRYDHLSQNWGSKNCFEILNGSKFWLVQQLWHKMLFFCNFVKTIQICVFCVFAFCVTIFVPFRIGTC